MLIRQIIPMLVALAVAVGALGIVSAIDPAEASAGTTVKSCTGKNVYLKDNERRLLYLHNKTRKDHGLRPLCVHPKLQKAARAHSKSMIRQDYFSHDSYNGNSFSKRLRNFGYNWSTAAENIAWGSGKQGNPGPIFRGWMESPGHRKNILTGRYREVGIGAYTGNYSGRKNTTMYTVDLGSRR